MKEIRKVIITNKGIFIAIRRSELEQLGINVQRDKSEMDFELYYKTTLLPESNQIILNLIKKPKEKEVSEEAKPPEEHTSSAL